MKKLNKLSISTKTGEILLNGKDAGEVNDIVIRIHDDDRITVTADISGTGAITLSPCEVDMHVIVNEKGQIDWLSGI